MASEYAFAISFALASFALNKYYCVLAGRRSNAEPGLVDSNALGSVRVSFFAPERRLGRIATSPRGLLDGDSSRTEAMVSALELASSRRWGHHFCYPSA